MGLDMQVTDAGSNLSLGEKQVIAFARALLRAIIVTDQFCSEATTTAIKPRALGAERTVRQPVHIMVLDEATSALDSQTEREIQAALNAVSKAQTTMVVAHRLSTIVDADEILVLAGGEIVERGTHRELLAINGLYAGMWARQSDGFKSEEAGQKQPMTPAAEMMPGEPV